MCLLARILACAYGTVSGSEAIMQASLQSVSQPLTAVFVKAANLDARDWL